MTPLLVLAMAVTCLAKPQTGTDLTKPANGNDPNDPDNKFFQIPFITPDQSNSVWGGALGAGAALLGQQVLNGVLGGGGGNGCGRRRRQSGDQNDPNNKFLGGLLGGGNNCGGGGGGGNTCPYPCYPCQGRKRRQADEKPDKKFLGNLFGNGGGNTCCCPQNRPPQQNPFPQNQNTRICQCSSASKTDNFGNQEAQCNKLDHTGRRWCYSTTNSRCADAQASKLYPRNPWSYQACGNSGR